MEPTVFARPRRHAEWALAAATVVAMVLLLAGAEAGLRALRPRFLRHTRVEHPHVYSEVYGWALRRGITYEGRDGRRITVNAEGYRGRAHSPAPGPGLTRVVLLGDSITFGTGAGDDETFAIGHLRPRGHRVAAEVIARELGQSFGQPAPP